MSGIAKVEIAGDRATVETARGTRYAFRRRENGIWGLTLFTAPLARKPSEPRATSRSSTKARRTTIATRPRAKR